jgi:HD-GYP domain-containing protein (c-di-GMP phosphodiesterase class II)
VDTPSEQVAVEVGQLKTGMTLQFDMHDQQGVLLLAAGQTISPEFRRLLEARSIQNVRMHNEDARGLKAVPTMEGAARSAQRWLDPQYQTQLQQLLGKGLANLSNRGPSVAERMLRHGAVASDKQLVEEISASQQQHARQLQALLGQAERGRTSQVTGSILNALKTSLKYLVTDLDAVLATRLSGCGESALAIHCLKLSQLSMALGVELGLNAENVCRLGMTALLHDWGWLRVPTAIRQLKRPLTRLERLEVEKHPAHSVDLLERVDGLPAIVPLVSYQIHEKLDGTGYPRGRTEQSIHLFARIVHVADDYLTLTTENGWRPPLTGYAAMCALLKQEQRRAADPVVLRALVRVLSLFPIGSRVELTDGSLAEVIRSNADRYTQPIVRRLTTAEGHAIDADSTHAVLDLSKESMQIVSAIPDAARQELTFLPDPAVYRRIDPSHADIQGPKWLETRTNAATPRG